MDSKLITVVSGLPRSGTSLMMQILEAGGLPVLCDGLRKADTNNPRGYYEYETVKALARDASWIGEAEGKVMKVVSLLLYHLPSDHRYRILFMTRRMDEILFSQSAMLDKLGQKNKGPEDRQMAQYYEKHLAKLEAWLPQQKHMEVLRCSYNALLDDPKPLLISVRSFLSEQLDLNRMLSVIDPKLYRQKAP
jgi:hypothetical protein